MLNGNKSPISSTKLSENRSKESIQKEEMQNEKMISLGIDPYEFDVEKEYTEQEQEIINCALRLIVMDKEVPEELAEKVREITMR
ncbi:MAG: hypothetical protein IJO65_08910 [Lachnospiraceae bacterium]|nr:hypothetical protein [Lachnospiraceae bacterium]